MKSLLKFLMIVTVGAANAPVLATQVTGNTPVMLEIINGETSFVVNPGLNTAYWVTGECRREIPMSNQTKNSNAKALVSRKISDKVTLGRDQVVLEQQFKFNLTDTPVSVEVFNSVRGGWTTIPVRHNQQCSVDAACLARMELPIC